jgi:hypothetical protein
MAVPGTAVAAKSKKDFGRHFLILCGKTITKNREQPTGQSRPNPVLPLSLSRRDEKSKRRKRMGVQFWNACRSDESALSFPPLLVVCYQERTTRRIHCIHYQINPRGTAPHSHGERERGQVRGKEGSRPPLLKFESPDWGCSCVSIVRS